VLDRIEMVRTPNSFSTAVISSAIRSTNFRL
jgi:hypothetical protein